MRYVILIAAIVLWIAGLGSFIYEFYPREVKYSVARMVPEKKVKTRTYIDADGNHREEIVEPTVEVYLPVWETKYRVPDREDQLRFIGLSCVVGLMLLYFSFVIVGYGLCCVTNRPANNALEIQIAGVVTFLTGIFGAAIAMPSRTDPSPSQPQVQEASRLPLPQVPSNGSTFAPTPGYPAALTSPPALDPSESVGPLIRTGHDSQLQDLPEDRVGPLRYEYDP